MNSASTKISLYIHIPFCSSKCKYCDFYSETNGFDRIELVITELINQLNNRYNRLGRPEVETIFIGGGTPSLIPTSELKRLLDAVSEIAPNPVEWSIESNPESITAEFLNLLEQSGINRISIGIQSFNKSLLKIIGRRATTNQIEASLALVKKIWTGAVSLDLISSLPGQTKDMVLEDITKAISYNPDHISFYALSLEEGTPLEDEVSKGLIEELSENDSENIWMAGRTLLNSAGYDNYEVSNYSKQSPSIHNTNYWELKPYLGIGPGAVSTLINDKGRIIRITNKKSITTFLEAEQSSWGEQVEVLSGKDFLEDYIIMGLRLKKGINRNRFRQIFNIELIDLLPAEFVTVSEDYICLTSHGFDIMNSVLIDVLKSLESVTLTDVNWFY